jgi:hypothetical protein
MNEKAIIILDEIFLNIASPHFQKMKRQIIVWNELKET